MAEGIIKTTGNSFLGGDTEKVISDARVFIDKADGIDLTGCTYAERAEFRKQITEHMDGLWSICEVDNDGWVTPDDSRNLLMRLWRKFGQPRAVERPDSEGSVRVLPVQFLQHTSVKGVPVSEFLDFKNDQIIQIKYRQAFVINNLQAVVEVIGINGATSTITYRVVVPPDTDPDCIGDVVIMAASLFLEKFVPLSE